jgi:DNA-binding protein HU-beta
MNKAELIEVLTEKLDTDRRHANDAVEHLIDAIVRAVQKGESVTITGFGVFERRRRAARVARNPRTGETVKVKPTSVPAFRPGAQFKAIVSGAQKLPAEGPAVRRGAVGGAVKKAAVKKAPAKKAAAVKKAPATKAVVKKAAPAKKVAVKKVAVAKAPVKKVAVKKVAVTKAPVKKVAVKKVAVAKAPAKKAPAKKGRR